MGFFWTIGIAIFGGAIFSLIKKVFTSNKEIKHSSTNVCTSYPYLHSRDPITSINRGQITSNYRNYNFEYGSTILLQYPSRESFQRPSEIVEKLPEFNQKPISFLQMEQLDEYPIPKIITAIESDDFSSQKKTEMMNLWMLQKDSFRNSERLYIGAYKIMAFCEEAMEASKTREYTFNKISLNRISGKNFYFSVSLKSSELFAAVDDKRLFRFTLKPRSGGKQLNGKIKERKSEKIFVDIYPAKEFRYEESYDIFFEYNRTVYQLQHNALNFIQKHRLFEILIKNPMYLYQYQNPLDSLSTVRYNSSKQVDLNDEQLQAIDSILNGNYNPVPYLLYGPPGTGKTKTIVAAIEKIVQITTKNILVCAPSNAACNEIAERLTKVLTPKQMLRMFSKSHELDGISETIQPYCNWYDDEINYPSLDLLYKYRVVICTLSTSGCLVRARHFNPKHFDYVFIDECASAHETMSLIPIAGLCTSLGKVHANIVLIGDPKQLDAVTKSEFAIKLGFKTSWFEQLFNQPLYKRHTVTGKFNHTFITQLVRNYRSHPKILQIPNELFYENSLQAVTSPELLLLDVEGLLISKKRFPIIFKSVQGYCQRPEDTTSSLNIEEVNVLMEFIELLLKQDEYKINESDIGVVSPYKLQCKTIQQRCDKKNYKHIQIGTAEVFQGQERKVMIVTTVQSGKATLSSFLKNPQRFNVMITRAKSLLIIVGDPHLLSQDSNWNKLIHFCFKNRCLIQGKRYFRPKN